MKTIKPLLLIAALFMLAPAACKKSDNKPKTTVSMTFTFNGTAETTAAVLATYYKSQNSVQIAGALNSTQALNLSIEDIKTGTFDLATDPTLIASFSTALDMDHTYFGTTGKIVITTFTADAIAGTFEFSGMNGLSQNGAITDGTFSASLLTE